MYGSRVGDFLFQTDTATKDRSVGNLIVELDIIQQRKPPPSLSEIAFTAFQLF